MAEEQRPQRLEIHIPLVTFIKVFAAALFAYAAYVLGPLLLLVFLPIAIQTALLAGLNPHAFAIMICVAASCSYLTPLEPSCLMVYGPGRYRFMDFVKVGTPLTLLIYLIALILVPWFWPLR